jgi:hypothetical protein
MVISSVLNSYQIQTTTLADYYNRLSLWSLMQSMDEYVETPYGWSWWRLHKIHIFESPCRIAKCRITVSSAFGNATSRIQYIPRITIAVLILLGRLVMPGQDPDSNSWQ